MSRGFVLVESTIVQLLLVLTIVALLPLFLLCLRANKVTEHIVVATQLATALMEEVRLRRWDEATPGRHGGPALPSALGPDPGEASEDKRTFDDVDDFNGWRESPPRGPMMEAVKGFPSYARTVSVRYVDADLVSESAASDFKHVRVCVERPKMRPLCLDTVLGNH